MFSNWPPKDPEDYADYLIDHFTKHFNRSEDTAIDGKVLFRKLDSAIAAFGHSECINADWHCISVYLHLIGSVLPRRNRLIARGEARKLSIKFRDAIFAILAKAEPDDRGHCAWLRQKLWRSYKILASECQWYAGTRNTECWHTDHFALLAKLNKLALDHTEPNVYLAVGERLPQELIDQVLEQSLLAEEITADISMRTGDGCPNLYWHVVENLPREYWCKAIKGDN